MQNGIGESSKLLPLFWTDKKHRPLRARRTREAREEKQDRIRTVLDIGGFSIWGAGLPVTVPAG